jgi:hypothetical protein
VCAAVQARHLVALLVALALSVPASALCIQHERLGPVPGRTRGPLYLLHLQPVLKRAEVLEPGMWTFGVEVDHSNICDRWVTHTPDGIEVIDLDLETIRTGFTARVGLPFGVELGLEVPLMTLTGGYLDKGIQGWHYAANLDNGDRELIPNNRFSYRVSRPGWFLRHEEPVPAALGDITIDGQVRILKTDAEKALPGLAARLLLKMPTGRFDLGAGSGAPDVSFVVQAEWGHRFMTWYGQVGVIALGRSPQLAAILRPTSFTWAIGLELNVAAPWSIIAQFHGHTAFHSGWAHPTMKSSPIGFQVGTKLRLGPIELCVTMGQDPLALDPSADLTLVAAIKARIPPRKNRAR